MVEESLLGKQGFFECVKEGGIVYRSVLGFWDSGMDGWKREIDCGVG